MASLIQRPTEATIRQAASMLADGQLVGVPTETVYGLAADATQKEAVRGIFEAKQRPANNPLILHFPTAEAASHWVRVAEPDWLSRQWAIAQSFWPGPLTVVVPKTDKVLDIVTAGALTVAVRVPRHPVMRSLLDACPFPLAAPSANPSNYVSPTRAEHVQQSLGHKVAMVLDGGSCESGIESTIIRLEPGAVRLLRPGGISVEVLSEAFGEVNLAPPADRLKPAEASEAALPAPGQMARHYSPVTRLCLEDQWDPKALPAAAVARIVFRRLSSDQPHDFASVIELSQTGNLEEVARNLFDGMRKADRSGCQLIVVDRCTDEGVGRAIMDRIGRASG